MDHTAQPVFERLLVRRVVTQWYAPPGSTIAVGVPLRRIGCKVHVAHSLDRLDPILSRLTRVHVVDSYSILSNMISTTGYKLSAHALKAIASTHFLS
jgi:hypothetical protein